MRGDGERRKNKGQRKCLGTARHNFIRIKEEAFEGMAGAVCVWLWSCLGVMCMEKVKKWREKLCCVQNITKISRAMFFLPFSLSLPPTRPLPHYQHHAYSSSISPLLYTQAALQSPCTNACLRHHPRSAIAPSSAKACRSPSHQDQHHHYQHQAADGGPEHHHQAHTHHHHHYCRSRTKTASSSSSSSLFFYHQAVFFFFFLLP